MTTLLERLRVENPVPHASPPPLESVWDKLDAQDGPGEPGPPLDALVPRRRTLRPSARRIAIAALCVVPVVAIFTLATESVPPSIAARVLAASDSRHAIVHYVAAVEQLQVQTRRLQSSRWDVWLAGSRAHVLIYQLGPRGSFLRAEITTNGNSIELYRPAPFGNTVTRGARPRSAATCQPALTMCGFRTIDPVALLRQLAMTRSLRQAGERSRGGRETVVLENQRAARILAPTGSWLLALRATVDSRTFVPIQVASTIIGPRGTTIRRTTATISGYQRLPLNARSNRLLRMFAHPSAVVRCGVFESDGSIGYPCRSR